MNPELKLAVHMDKEDAQDNLELKIERLADTLFFYIDSKLRVVDDYNCEKFQNSNEWHEAVGKYADRIAREELEG